MVNKPPEILVIKSDTSELVIVESFLRRIFVENFLSEKHFNKVYLCVSEAIINSIKHGNKSDSKKSVIVKIKCSEQEIVVLIEDEGDGFDKELLIDPTLTGNLKKESGRGIFIIKNIAESMEFNEKGNCIQFKLKCGE